MNIYELSYFNDLTNNNLTEHIENYYYDVIIKNNNNESITMTITTNLKTINDIIKIQKLKDFIMKYDDNYFLFIQIKYFDNHIENFFIKVKRLKSMF